MIQVLYRWSIWLLLCRIRTNASASDHTILDDVIGAAITPTAGQTQPLVILPLRHLGLGNRLRIISGIHNVALNSGRRLLVLWLPSEECNSGFHALLSEMHETLTVYDVDPTSPIGMHFDRSITDSLMAYADEHSLSLATIRPQDFFVDLTKLADRRHQDISLLLVWTLGIHTPAQTPCVDYLFAKSTFYRGLKPSRAVMARMHTSLSPGTGTGTGTGTGIDIDTDSSTGSGFPGTTTRVVGIHVRAYDNDFDWAVVTPINSSTPALRFDEASPLEAFVLVMQQIATIHPTTRFFVASNSVQAKRELRNRFGDRVIITIDTVDGPATSAHSDRSSENGMILATADFFLLASCAYVVHSRGSSFAREAGAVHMRPVIDLAVDNRRTVLSVLTQHTALPHCGMHEYIRCVRSSVPSPDPATVLIGLPVHDAAIETTCADGTCPSPQYNLECYKETGDRRMCTVSFTSCPCVGQYHQRDFGIPSLLCNVDDSTGVEAGPGHHDVSQCVTLLAESNGYSL